MQKEKQLPAQSSTLNKPIDIGDSSFNRQKPRAEPDSVMVRQRRGGDRRGRGRREGEMVRETEDRGGEREKKERGIEREKSQGGERELSRSCRIQGGPWRGFLTQ